MYLFIYCLCTGISCPELSVPDNGRLHASGYYPTDRVLEGSSRRICTHKGSWTGSDPKCVKDYYPHDGYKYSDNYYNHYKIK